MNTLSGNGFDETCTGGGRPTLACTSRRPSLLQSRGQWQEWRAFARINFTPATCSGNLKRACWSVWAASEATAVGQTRRLAHRPLEPMEAFGRTFRFQPIPDKRLPRPALLVVDAVRLSVRNQCEQSGTMSATIASIPMPFIELIDVTPSLSHEPLALRGGTLQPLAQDEHVVEVYLLYRFPISGSR
jgi:hypothetical protein